jgi:Asp-tRNA(Asn)/Glu-tRNA(Gln) amidotransferase A subunit family amidase
VPFAVKNLFDVAGLPTRAGSKINRNAPAAMRDAALIERLESAGAILVGALNMGEYAYDFTGENIHDGPSHNPHDLERMTGGSSGGSGAAVAGGLVPLALGSDTNGSIRVPSSLCGIFGLKPTYGRLSRARTFPFVASLDHLGPFARNTRDLALAYDAMQGRDSDDPACADRAAEPVVPLSLGSDTNGSIRVPASLCGLFGLKATYGRLSRAHTYPFVASLDHVGPLARSARDLALAYDAMQGHDVDDPVCAERSVEPVTPLLERGDEGLRVAVAGGYFKCRTAETVSAMDRVAAALGANRDIELPHPDRARSAAFVITASEGGALHLDRMRTRARDYDPAVRDRLIAGAMTPASLVVKAQKFRRWYRQQVLKLFDDVDAILAPATPCTAPLSGQQMFMLDGVELPVRANLGIYTQPISFIGLPVVAVPVPLSPLPIAVQIICAPWREDIALRIAHALEKKGVAAAPRPAF